MVAKELDITIMNKYYVERNAEEELKEKERRAKAYSAKIRREKQKVKDALEVIIGALIATPIAYAALYLLFGIANKIPPMF